MSEILRIVGTILMAVAGPILCYIVVFGTANLIRYFYISRKAKSFQKRMDTARKKMEEEGTFDDIEVDVYVPDKNSAETDEILEKMEEFNDEETNVD